MELLGLTKFQSPAPSDFYLSGTIKESEADFCVTEILPDHILDDPPAKKSRSIEHFELQNDEKSRVTSILGSEEVKAIAENFKNGKTISYEKTLGTFDDSYRRSVHQLVSKLCPYMVTTSNKGVIVLKSNMRSFGDIMKASSFESSCSIHQISPFSDGDSITIKEEKFETKTARAQFSSEMRKYFAKLIDFKFEGDCTYRIWLKKRPNKTFKLVKIKRTGLEHNEMLAIIARALRINKNDICYAGTKDARATIIQYLSVLSSSEVTLKHPKIELLKIDSFHRHLQLGELTCNQFSINISNMKESCAKQSKDRLEKIVNNGFINYFGLQRFGVKQNAEWAPTPLIGLALITGDYNFALKVAFDTRDSDDKTRAVIEEFSESVKLNDLMDTKTIHKASLRAIKKLHPGRKLLVSLLESLRAIKTDITAEAIWNGVNLRLKQFYVQSGSSLLWNRRIDTQENLDFIGSTASLYKDDLNYLSKEFGFSINDNYDQNLTRIGLKKNVICGSRSTRCYPSDVRMNGNNIKFSLQKSSYATMFLRELSMGNIN